jgi:hypothetical protein
MISALALVDVVTHAWKHRDDEQSGLLGIERARAVPRKQVDHWHLCCLVIKAPEAFLQVWSRALKKRRMI